MYVDEIPLEAHNPIEYIRNHPQKAVEKICELQAENDKLKNELEQAHNQVESVENDNLNLIELSFQKRVEYYMNVAQHYKTEVDKLKEALESIELWANAYPLDVFPKPDLRKASAALKLAGMTLDSISADNMRHVLNGVKGIVSEALKDK